MEGEIEDKDAVSKSVYTSVILAMQISATILNIYGAFAPSVANSGE
jgi:hypothetical protein